MYSDSLNPFGLLNGKIISVDKVESGLSCGCICPQCKGALVAKKGHSVVHHFSHYRKTNCTGSLETALHIKAKDYFLKHKSMQLPYLPGYFSRSNFKPNTPYVYKTSLGASIIGEDRHQLYIEYDDVFIETSIGKIRPDVILSGIEPFIVEIYVTHRTTTEKIEQIKKLRLSAIEIDLRPLLRLNILDSRIIENFVIGCTHTKTWISHPPLASRS